MWHIWLIRAMPRRALRSGALRCVCLRHAFTLQTLVKRKHLAQRRMLAMNALLMALCSAAAARVVARSVPPAVAAASLALNFHRRGHELSNTALLLLGNALAA